MPSGITSEKFIRAERRNRLENYRLDVAYRHIDRDTTRMHCDINREKRSITKAFRSVVKTTGFSDRGMPPRNDKDTGFEKCPSYRQGLRLSNKRLLQWKDAEKQLNKFIFQHENKMMHANKKKVIRNPDKVYETGKLKKDYGSTDDVFHNNDTVAERVSPMESLHDGSKSAGEFNVTAWQKQIVQGYQEMVRKPTQQRSSSVGSGNASQHELRSKSSPVISTKRDNDTCVITRVRPHTAHAQIINRPASAKSLPRRPTSALDVRDKRDEKNKFLITKDGIYIRNGQTFDKLSDGRPVDKPPLVNNYLAAPPPDGMKRSASGRSINSLCPVREDNEEDAQADDTDTATEQDNKDVKRDTSAQKVVPMSADGRQHASKVLHKWQRFGRSKARSASATSQRSSSSHDEQGHLQHSKSDLGFYIENNRRSRKDSGSVASTMVSLPPSRSGSVSSVKLSTSLGIPEDIEEFSKCQAKLASEITAERPLSTNRLVSIASVVKAAMTFSKLARKRGLNKMVEENSSDSHEVIRQERLRKLKSRQNILSSLGQHWQTDSKPIIDAVE